MNCFFRTKLFLLLGLLTLTGCGDKVHVTGKVTFSDDGSPLPVGMILFETDHYLARGKLKPDGTYNVDSVSKRDGLPPGFYRVSISGAVEEMVSGKDGSIMMQPLIDEKYTSNVNSGLTIEITPSTHRFDFQVDRYTKQKKSK